ncbi:MAG: hypothetical protein ACP5MD_16880 [Verrucomicrobiia bacterium]
MNGMNSEQFEDYLRRQPLRGTPPGWRRSILDEAANASSTRARSGSSKRWAQALVGWMWPRPTAWAALAAAWVAILVLNQLAAPTPDECARARAGAAIAEANLQLLGRFYELDVTAETSPVRPSSTPKSSPPDQGSLEWPETSAASQT